MKHPRWLQHLYAILRGYFWHPCPICGEDFGFHERNRNAYLMANWVHSWCICPKRECYDEAMNRNIQFMVNNIDSAPRFKNLSRKSTLPQADNYRFRYPN